MSVSSEKEVSGKRPASSPAGGVVATGKKPCVAVDDSFADPDATIIEAVSDVRAAVGDFMSSTLLDSPQDHAAAPNRSINCDIVAALRDPEVLELISSAVAAKVSSSLKGEVSLLKGEMVLLRKQLSDRDSVMTTLHEKIDELEQYSRRNCIRITAVPETPTEDTAEIAKKVAASVGVTLSDDAIDRSHRVGAKPSGADTYTRPIIVKLTAYRHKEALMRARKGLSQCDPGRLFPDLSWPSLPSRPAGAGQPRNARPGIFINEDLTRVRAVIAAKARGLKRERKVDDTWVRDGRVFVKVRDSKYVLTNQRDLDSLISRLRR